jgi:FlaA1/EpsC-like NDP-sugar epimerase
MWNITSPVSAEALLKRATTPVYGEEAKRLIENRTALVTGAGGSIGSDIVRQLHLLKAASVICVDNNEYALYMLERELTGTALLVDKTMVLADIRDLHTLEEIVDEHRPEIVFHAAACKHLPLLERSPNMAVVTNVLGTYNVAEACVNSGVQRLVNISTDKASNPTSVLGVSKRLAEIIIQSYAGQGMLTASVRFGNVFASRGSFIETLTWQVANDKPVTLTDEAMTRFFMTIPQAVGLVIEAAVMANDGNTFVLNMGDSYRIKDIIQRHAETIGAHPEIIVTGMRPGEKLDETLFDVGETRTPTRHPAISMVAVAEPISLNDILNVCMAAKGASASKIRSLLFGLIVHPTTSMAMEV